MFNELATNTSIIFAPNTRGNFVRNCLTLSPNVADASLRMTNSESRVELYKKRILSHPSITDNPPWGPGHVDGLAGDSRERLSNSDSSNHYFHCSHLISMSFLMDLPNSKFIVITLDEEAISHFSNKYHYDTYLLKEINYYNDFNFLTNFTKSKKWYNLPYNDILNKDKFINHCTIINSEVVTDMISDYYDVYYSLCIEDNPR